LPNFKRQKIAAEWQNYKWPINCMMNSKSIGVGMMDINSVQGTSYLPSQAPTVSQNYSSGFSYAMGQVSAAGGGLTPAVAQSLMYRSMTTGVPNAEFDQYGGYSAVKAIFTANGGSYSLNAIPADQRKALAMQVASTGMGNMSAPITENILQSRLSCKADQVSAGWSCSTLWYF
jgi:hypothetical protein